MHVYYSGANDAYVKGYHLQIERVKLANVLPPSGFLKKLLMAYSIARAYYFNGANIVDWVHTKNFVDRYFNNKYVVKLF